MAQVAAETKSGGNPSMLEPRWSIDCFWWLRFLTFGCMIKGLSIASSLCTQFAPLPEVAQIISVKNTGCKESLSYVCIACTGMQWCLYGISAYLYTGNHGFLVVVYANIVGACMGVYYSFSFFRFVSEASMQFARMKLYMTLGVSAFLLQLLLFFRLPHEQCLLASGCVSATLSVLVTISPLATLPTVLESRSVESMPVELSVVSFVSSWLWLACGLLLNDWWILIPNIVGILVGVVTCYLIFGYSKEYEGSLQAVLVGLFTGGNEPEAAGDPPPGDEAAAAPSGAEADGNENPPVVPSGSEQENPPSNSDELGLQPSENDLILQAAGEEVHETEEEEEEHGGEDEMLGKGEMAPEYPPSQLARAPYWRMWWSRSHSYADEEAEAETFTVSRADMMTYLNTQLWFNEAAYGIPFTIALWAIFLILLGLHGEIESNYQVQSAVGGALVSVVGYPELGNTPAASIGTAVTGDNQLQSTSAAPTTCHCACVPRADFSEPEACQVDALNRNYLDIKSVVDGRFFPEYSEGELRNQMYKQKTDNMAFQDPVPFREIKDQSTLWFWIQHGAFPFLWQEADFAELALAREAIATSTTTTTTPELVVADDDGNSTETITTTLGSNAGIVAPLSIAGRPGRLYVTNQLIGGVRLRQKRMKMTSDCDVDPGLQSFYNAECRTSDAETGNWRNVQHPCFRPNSDLDGVFDCPFDVGRKLDSPNGPLETIEYRLIPFEWLDGATEEVELQAAFFNAEVRLYSYVRLTFTFESGGFMEKTHKVSAISANMYPTFWYIVPDLIFLSMISQLLYQEGMEVINAKREGLLKFYLSDFWNLVDWFSILAGFLISFLWFNIVLRTESVGDLVAALGPTPETVDEGYRKKWMTIIDDLESLGSSQDVQFMFLYWYTLVLMLRFFKNFQGQPRLSQISSTLLKSIMDMGHFLIVFSVVFVNFAIGGNLMFGTSSEDWSTIMGAINTSMMALLGNLDMDQLMEVSPLTAYLWFWSFMVVNWYLLLNLLVAIVFDHYYSFRDTVGETQGLGSQIVDVFHEKTWATDWYLQRKQYLKKGIIPKPDYKVFRFFDPAKFGYLFLDEQMSYEDVYDALVEESPEGVLYGRPTILEQKTEKRNADRAAFEESLKEENTKREEIRAGIRSRAGSKEGPGGGALDLIPLPSSVVVPDHEGGRKIRGGKAAKACSPGDALGGPYDSPFKEGRHRADDDDSPSPGGRADESPSPGGELGVEPRFARHLMLRCRKHVLDETGYEEKRKQELTSLSIESNKMLETVVQDCETLQKQMTVIIDGVTKSCADLEGAIDDTHMVLANLQVERGVLACQGTALTATTYKDILWNKGQLVSTVPGLKQVADKKMKAALSIMGGGGFRGSPFGGGGGSPFATLTGGASSGGAGGTAGKFKALLAPNSG
eukprot:g2769.t1